MHDVVVAGAGRGGSRAESEPGQGEMKWWLSRELFACSSLPSTGLPDVFPTLLQSEEP